MINGTDGTIYPSTLAPPDRFYFFSIEMCRSLYMDYKESLEFRGISSRKYVMTEQLFAIAKENDCFCRTIYDDEGEEQPDCSASGTIDLSPCIKAPIYLSLPHFLFGNKKLFAYPSGLNPKLEKHQSYVVIDPVILHVNTHTHTHTLCEQHFRIFSNYV